MESINNSWVKFVQAYHFNTIYINAALVSSVQRHSAWTREWAVITSGDQKFVVLEPIEVVLEMLGIEK